MINTVRPPKTKPTLVPKLAYVAPMRYGIVVMTIRARRNPAPVPIATVFVRNLFDPISPTMTGPREPQDAEYEKLKMHMHAMMNFDAVGLPGAASLTMAKSSMQEPDTTAPTNKSVLRGTYLMIGIATRVPVIAMLVAITALMNGSWSLTRPKK